MSAWKQLERDMAALFGGARFWANSGEKLDFEAPHVLGQCKLRRTLSLEALTQLAESAEAEWRVKQKLGVVCVKVRRGRGRPSPVLIVLTAKMWEEYFSRIKAP